MPATIAWWRREAPVRQRGVISRLGVALLVRGFFDLGVTPRRRLAARAARHLRRRRRLVGHVELLLDGNTAQECPSRSPPTASTSSLVPMANCVCGRWQPDAPASWNAIKKMLTAVAYSPAGRYIVSGLKVAQGGHLRHRSSRDSYLVVKRTRK